MRISIDQIAYDNFGYEWFSSYQLVDALMNYHKLIARKAHYLSVHQVASLLRRNPNIESINDNGINLYRVKRSSENINV